MLPMPEKIYASMNLKSFVPPRVKEPSACLYRNAVVLMQTYARRILGVQNSRNIRHDADTVYGWVGEYRSLQYGALLIMGWKKSNVSVDILKT